jgi:hypothetical protein
MSETEPQPGTVATVRVSKLTGLFDAPARISLDIAQLVLAGGFVEYKKIAAKKRSGLLKASCGHSSHIVSCCD